MSERNDKTVKIRERRKKKKVKSQTDERNDEKDGMYMTH